jgi:hypothetical protein
MTSLIESYLTVAGFIGLVLSPLYPPIAVTVVHWLKTRSERRPTLPTVEFVIRHNSAARSTAIEAA